MKNVKIEFENNLYEYLIETYTYEGGVRKLKELLTDILSEINMRYLKNDNEIFEINNDVDNYINENNENNENNNSNFNFPYYKVKLTKELIENHLLKNKRKITNTLIENKSCVGLVNALWASDYGNGGITHIESAWMPSKEMLQLHLTGMLGQVMIESMSVAKTVAWKILPENIRNELHKNLLITNNGIHLHCPCGASPKDGPSAGGAITTSLFSLMTNIPIKNKVAMTGEINLRGNITAIGGLEDKLFGAKNAGIELVLCPEENLYDLNQTLTKFPNLIDNTFNVKTVKNIWEILDFALVEKINYSKYL